MSIESTAIEHYVYQLGRGVRDEAVVVGSAAVALAFNAAGVTFRQPQDVDVALTPASYEYVRSQPGWEERIEADGAHLLSSGVYDVGMGLKEVSHQDLRERSWQTTAGVQVASLADIYIYKQARGLGKDAADMATIRAKLQNPDSAPMPAQVLTREIETVRAVLPEALSGSDEAQLAVRLAANGLHIISTLYGHAGIGRVGRIVGALEKPTYDVPATYHNGFGLPEDMRLLQRHFANVGASDAERLDGLVSDAYSDAVYGNGRYSDNPDGHDELLSARLVAGHARQLGYGASRIARLRSAILGTTFDERTRDQRGKHDPAVVVRAVAGVDLQGLSEPGSVESSIELAIEDGYSSRFSPARVIGKVLTERGVSIDSISAGLEAIDTYGHMKPADAPDGPTVLQAFAGRLLGNASFHELHEYPDGWTLDNPALRHDHALFLRALHARLTAPEGAITAAQAYDLARTHTAAMRARYS